MSLSVKYKQTRRPPLQKPARNKGTGPNLSLFTIHCSLCTQPFRENSPQSRNNEPKSRNNRPKSRNNEPKSRKSKPKSRDFSLKFPDNKPKTRDFRPKTRVFCSNSRVVTIYFPVLKRAISINCRRLAVRPVFFRASASTFPIPAFPSFGGKKTVWCDRDG